MVVVEGKNIKHQGLLVEDRLEEIIFPREGDLKRLQFGRANFYKGVVIDKNGPEDNSNESRWLVIEDHVRKIIFLGEGHYKRLQFGCATKPRKSSALKMRSRRTL